MFTIIEPEVAAAFHAGIFYALEEAGPKIIALNVGDVQRDAYQRNRELQVQLGAQLEKAFSSYDDRAEISIPAVVGWMLNGLPIEKQIQPHQPSQVLQNVIELYQGNQQLVPVEVLSSVCAARISQHQDNLLRGQREAPLYTAAEYATLTFTCEKPDDALHYGKQAFYALLRFIRQSKIAQSRNVTTEQLFELVEQLGRLLHVQLPATGN